MNTTKIATISEAGGNYNEDIAHVVSNAAWVLDGATGLSQENHMPGDSDAKWYVEAWDTYLTDAVTISDNSLEEIVLAGIAKVNDEYRQILGGKAIEEIDVPSSGIALIRWGKEELEYFILGDCQLWIMKNESVEKIADYKLPLLDDEVSKRMNTYIKQGIAASEARNKIKQLLIENRLLKNKKNGYWILSLDQEAVAHAISGKLSFNHDDQRAEILLLSDGYYAIVDKYKALTEKEVFDKIEAKGLESVYHLIRQIEEKDPNQSRFARFKKSDDASAIFISFNPMR